MAIHATPLHRALRLRDDVEDRFGEGLAGLQHQLAEIAGAMEHLVGPPTSGAARNLAHFAHEVQRQTPRAARMVGREMGREARIVGTTLRDNPVPVVVGLLTLGLLVSLLSRNQQG